jgi:Cu/Ag efflux pump CusA
MITKNAVILIGQIDAERALGKNIQEAAIDASSSRFRPIMLTAVSTVPGTIPIAPTVFWGPMAYAIMGGLLVGTNLTLVFLTTLYVTWFEASERIKRSSAPPADDPAATGKSSSPLAPGMHSASFERRSAS